MTSVRSRREVVQLARGQRRRGAHDPQSTRTLALEGRRGCTVRWEIRHERGAPLGVVFAPELALSLLDGNSLERSYALDDRQLSDEERKLSSRGEWSAVRALKLVNQANLFKVELVPSAPAEVWRFPLETVSNSESGFERTYQGSVIVFRFPLRLAAGETAKFSLTLHCQDL